MEHVKSNVSEKIAYNRFISIFRHMKLAATEHRHSTGWGLTKVPNGHITRFTVPSLSTQTLE